MISSFVRLEFGRYVRTIVFQKELNNNHQTKLELPGSGGARAVGRHFV